MMGSDKASKEGSSATPAGGNVMMPWLFNMAGATLPDEDMGNIRYPRLELHTHVMFKTIQLGTVVGLVVVGPARALLGKGPRTLSNAWNLAKRSAIGGAMIGVPAGPLMTEMTIRKAEPEAIYDRTYRLRYNKGQCNVDRMAVVGGITGGLLGSTLAVLPPHGAAIGMVGGIATAAVMNNMRSKKEKAKEIVSTGQ